MPTASGCSSRPATSSSTSPAATTSRTTRACCRARIASFGAFENAMTLDIAMGGSTNTVLHLLAAAHEGEVDFTMADIDRAVAAGAGAVQGRAGQVRRAHGGRPPRRRHHGDPRRARPRRADQPRPADGAHARRIGDALDHWDISRTDSAERARLLHGRARRRADAGRLQPGPPLGRARPRPREGRHPRRPSTPSPRTAASPCSTATSRSTAAS